MKVNKPSFLLVAPSVDYSYALPLKRPSHRTPLPNILVFISVEDESYSYLCIVNVAFIGDVSCIAWVDFQTSGPR